jgi:DNA-binding NtrC family response regulator
MVLRAWSRDTSPGKGAPMARTCDILVVEDNAEIGALVNVLLDQEGYCVDVVADYRAAAAKLDSARFDLVLLDTPGAPLTAAHWDAMAQLRELARDTPVILFTAHHDDTLTDQVARGFHGVIRKPFDLDTLVAVVERAMPDDCAAEAVVA